MRRFMRLLFYSLFSLSAVGCSAYGDEYFMYADFWCAMHSREPSQVEYLVDWYFNEEFTMQYNSTVGNWTGFTPAGLITASALNEDKHDVLQRKVEKQMICVANVDLIFNVTEENIAEPSVSLVETSSTHHDTMLVCSAYDFYPKDIILMWHLNGQEVTSDVISSEVMANGDWTYQVHSYLEFMPGRHNRVSCVVEHASLREPKVYDWDTSLNQRERSYLIGGVCALLVGGVFLSLGLIHYRKKTCDPRLSNAL